MGLRQLFYRLDNGIVWLTGALITVMIVHICLDVAGKYLFGIPIPGTIAVVTNYYMPVITFLPLAYVQRSDGHISVEVITGNFPKAVQRHLLALTLLVGVVVFAILSYYTGVEAMVKFRLGTFFIEQGILIPTWPGYFCPPVGYGMMCIMLLIQFGRYLTGADPIDGKGDALPEPHTSGE